MLTVLQSGRVTRAHERSISHPLSWFAVPPPHEIQLATPRGNPPFSQLAPQLSINDVRGRPSRLAPSELVGDLAWPDQGPSGFTGPRPKLLIVTECPSLDLFGRNGGLVGNGSTDPLSSRKQTAVNRVSTHQRLHAGIDELVRVDAAWKKHRRTMKDKCGINTV